MGDNDTVSRPNEAANEVCRKCARLVAYRESIKPKAPLLSTYWNKPVLPLGDLGGWLLIIGLAPGAHGANRTSQAFVGDGAGLLLHAALYECGFSNRRNPVNYDPGLEFTGALIVNCCRCVPPANRPTAEEFTACRPFLRETLFSRSFTHVLCIGRDAHEQLQRTLGIKGPAFKHGAYYALGKFTVADCFHTSRYNQNTRKIRVEDVIFILEKIKKSRILI